MTDQRTPENGSAHVQGGPTVGVVPPPVPPVPAAPAAAPAGPGNPLAPAAAPDGNGNPPPPPVAAAAQAGAGNPQASTWARDAAIFFPPIARTWSDQDTFNVVRRIQASMNYVATPAATFKTESRQVDVGDPGDLAGEDAKVTVFTISRTDIQPEQRLLDVYPLNYHRHLEGDMTGMPLWRRMVLIAGATLISIVRAITSWNTTRSKGVKEMWQFALSAGGLAVLGIYLIMLVVAIWPDVANAVQAITQPESTRSAAQVATGAQQQSLPPTWSEWFKAAFAWFSRVFTVVIAATALYSFKLDQAKQFFAQTGEIAHSMVNYFENYNAQIPVSSQLRVLTSDLAQRQYEHLYIVGYSFGSIIALDALFPRDREPDQTFSAAPKRTLITIGCPFDYIRTFWPKFWTQRHVAEGLPQRWINIYIRRDILGSNFRDDTQPGEATHGINSPLQQKDDVAAAPNNGANVAFPVRMPDVNIRYAEDRDLGWTDAVRFVGYAEHLNYWTKDVGNESAFDWVVGETHADDAALK